MGRLDAFQRQLKRFDIKVGGAASDQIAKFFATSDSAALFPEYVARAVRQGMEEAKALEAILASTTVIDSMDYRTISTLEEDMTLADVMEGGFIPQTTIKLRESLVHLYKRGADAGPPPTRRSSSRSWICLRWRCGRSGLPSPAAS